MEAKRVSSPDEQDRLDRRHPAHGHREGFFFSRARLIKSGPAKCMGEKRVSSTGGQGRSDQISPPHAQQTKEVSFPNKEVLLAFTRPCSQELYSSPNCSHCLKSVNRPLAYSRTTLELHPEVASQS